MDYTMAAEIHSSRTPLKCAGSMGQQHAALKRNLSLSDMGDSNGAGNVSSEEGAEKKRLRVENIVTSICQPR